MGCWSRAVVATLATTALALSACPPGAAAAAAPTTVEIWVTDVAGQSAVFHAGIEPNGAPTTYQFEYVTEAAFRSNVDASPSRDGFVGASKVPFTPASIPASGSLVFVQQHPTSLVADTNYRYRVVATNSGGTSKGPAGYLATKGPAGGLVLLDGRGWEMVSPVDKSGGGIQGFGENLGGDVLQAAADGNAATFSSASSFASVDQGAPPASQYVARRTTSGWETQNVSTPLLAGSYGDEPDGVPYQGFSTDLSLGLLSNGERCRGNPIGNCPVVNPPLPGSGAPAGYRDYYLREPSGGFQALVRSSDIVHSALPAEDFEVRFATATPTFSSVVLTSCAALTSTAVEVAAGNGCEPSAQNLYEWSEGELKQLNILPGDTQGTPGATIGAPTGAISANGALVYWTEAGKIYLRDGGQTKLLPQSAGAELQAASADGRFAFFLAPGGVLFRYDADAGTAIEVAPGEEVTGMLGASSAGSIAYYLGATGLFRWTGGGSSKIASAADAGDYPPALGTARVSNDGSRLLFTSDQVVTPYQNEGFDEVYLYGPRPGGGPATIACVSCRPSGERPTASASIPGAVANGASEAATAFYKPRVLSADGSRVFFDTSDPLVVQDTDNRADVYEWEAPGTGNCGREVGCVNLISSGRSAESSTFVDASESGSDVFFLTSESLVPIDPGSSDLYDAREGGGFPVPAVTSPCVGDACQILPAAPEDPSPGTLVPSRGNGPLQFPSSSSKRGKHKRHKRHKKHSRSTKKKHSGHGHKKRGQRHAGSRR